MYTICRIVSRRESPVSRRAVRSKQGNVAPKRGFGGVDGHEFKACLNFTSCYVDFTMRAIPDFAHVETVNCELCCLLHCETGQCLQASAPVCTSSTPLVHMPWRADPRQTSSHSPLPDRNSTRALIGITIDKANLQIWPLRLIKIIVPSLVRPSFRGAFSDL